MARLFASEDATVALLNLTESRGPAVADGILQESAETLFIPADTNSQAGVAEVARTTTRTFGRLDGSGQRGRVRTQETRGQSLRRGLGFGDGAEHLGHAPDPQARESADEGEWEVIIDLSSVSVCVEADWYVAYHANKGGTLR